MAEKREITDSKGGGEHFHLLILGLNTPPFYLYLLQRLLILIEIIGMSSPDPNLTKKNLAVKSNTWGFNDGRLWVFECKQITNAEKKLSWHCSAFPNEQRDLHTVFPLKWLGTTTCRCLCTITKIVTALLCIQGRVHLLKVWLIINGHRLKSLTLSAKQQAPDEVLSMCMHIITIGYLCDNVHL